MFGIGFCTAVRPLCRKARRQLLVGACALAVSSCSLVVDTKDREGCTTTSECTKRYGEPSACINSECIPLLTPECTEVWPPNALAQDNVILVGLLGALTGPDPYGEPTTEGAKLALSEIENSATGFSAPLSAPDSGHRHLAMLVCDHGSDPVRVARHLVNDAKVQMIIGASFSTATLKIFDQVASPANVFVLSPSATSPELSDHVDKGLLWRTTPSDVVQAEALKHLVVDVEHVLKESKIVPEGQRARITMPWKDDSAGSGLQKSVTKQDEEHPAPAVVVTQVDRYDNPDNPDVAQPLNWQSHVDLVLNSSPNIILAMGTAEFVANMMPGIEDGWNGALPKPWYVFPEGDRSPALSQLVAERFESDPGLNQRIIGTAPGARQSALYEPFRRGFVSAFQHEPGNLAEFGYDAGYLAAFAIAVADRISPTGRQLADAMTKLSCKGDPKSVVQAGGKFTRDFTTAQTQGCVDFDGASGPLDFDANGEALSDIGMWCVRRNPDKTSGAAKDSLSFGFEPLLSDYYSITTSTVIDKTQGQDPLDLTRDRWCTDAVQ
ncbi:MAG TPA: ABC transporter substrate-binding protein [Polyangiaceae bacterium]|nr:ABC transporter substrate-binding protein [Polyangiaceae bacterium]